MTRLVTLVLALVAATPATAAVYHVDSVADQVDADPGDGVCETASGACTLRAAVQQANAASGSDRIRIPAGTYQLTLDVGGEDGAATGDLDLRGTVRLIGAGEDATIVDADGLGDRVFDVRPQARVTIAKLTVRGGAASGSSSGGGIHTASGSKVTTLKRLVVERNSAFVGGGISALGRLRLSMSTVRNNDAAAGGGLAVAPGSTVRASTFDGNLATGVSDITGYDIAAAGAGTVTIVNSTITGQIQTFAFCSGGGPPCSNGSNVTPAEPAECRDRRWQPDAPGSGGTACEATDQRGVTRPQGARCDVGAVEADPVGPTPTPTPTPIPPGLGARCICSCDIPYQPYGCPGLHPCVVPSVVPATEADCDAFSAPGRGCHQIADFAAFLDAALFSVFDCQL